MSAVPSFSSSQSADGIPADSTIPSGTDVSGSPALSQSVGHHRLSDSERENAIHRCGDLFLKYMAKYEATSDLQYLGDARRALLNQSLLIKGRSPEQVARIAAEEGR